MSGDDCVLFTAGHGFYHFAISRHIFDRSLYYNLLLQPKLAIPDHYFLQGEWMGAHLEQYPARDSWLEVGLRNGFIVPYFRLEGRDLSEILDEMLKGDRRGFSKNASHLAERLSRTPSTPRYWSSMNNSKVFGDSLSHYLMATQPPMMEMGAGLDPDDFCGFWSRSRGWIADELALGYECSTTRLRAPGMLLSQMIQVSGERVLGQQCGKIRDIAELLTRVKNEQGPEAHGDLRAYYTLVCELYNRSLSDTLSSDRNSPEWRYYIATLDMWREQLVPSGTAERATPAEDVDAFDVVINLPKLVHLRHVSGDTLLAIRRSPACERFFESLSNWKACPTSATLRGELVDTLERYSELIIKQVGDSVGLMGLRPQFVSRVSDILRLVDRSPQFVHGLLAVAGASALGASALAEAGSPSIQISLFGLFAALTTAKLILPYEGVAGAISPARGVHLHGDVSISRT
jgi:hypothetical protein